MITLRLRALLKEKGKTRYWLAKASGVSQTTVYALCKEKPLKRIDAEVLERFCRALDCSPGDLLELRDG